MPVGNDCGKRQVKGAYFIRAPEAIEDAEERCEQRDHDILVA
jgi:hypothetical protein